MTQRCLGAVVLACTVLASGCADSPEDNVELRCDQEPRADVYEAGMIRTGADGEFRVRLVASTPSPPDKGDNLFTLEVLEVGSDTVVPNATIGVTPFMPDHNHGTPIMPVTSDGVLVGQYDVDRINLWMPGLWEVRVDVTLDVTQDLVVFAFCVEG